MFEYLERSATWPGLRRGAVIGYVPGIIPRRSLYEGDAGDDAQCSEWVGWPLENVSFFGETACDGGLELRFTSVDFAGRAYGFLSNFRAWHGAVVCYAPDPCAGSVEELMQ